MDDKSSPEVASFMIRFVRDEHTEMEGLAHHGLVRHVQTDKEIFFSCWDEVEAFIQQVIPLNTESSPKKE